MKWGLKQEGRQEAISTANIFKLSHALNHYSAPRLQMFTSTLLNFVRGNIIISWKFALVDMRVSRARRRELKGGRVRSMFMKRMIYHSTWIFFSPASLHGKTNNDESSRGVEMWPGKCYVIKVIRGIKNVAQQTRKIFTKFNLLLELNLFARDCRAVLSRIAYRFEFPAIAASWQSFHAQNSLSKQRRSLRARCFYFGLMKYYITPYFNLHNESS